MADKLHYDKDALLADYRATFAMFIKALAIAVGGVLVYFFILIVYLGGWSHTKAEPFIKQFGSRVEYEYTGTKLPQFGGPAQPETTETH